MICAVGVCGPEIWKGDVVAREGQIDEVRDPGVLAAVGGGVLFADGGVGGAEGMWD